MVRPEESHSEVSVRPEPPEPKATTSETCSPSESITRSICPLLSSKAMPVCGLRRYRVLLSIDSTSLSWEWAALYADRPPVAREKGSATPPLQAGRSTGAPPSWYRSRRGWGSVSPGGYALCHG